MVDRVAPDEDGEFDLGHHLQQNGMPLLSEALARRQVTRLARTREVEVHGDDGNLAWIVERVTVHAQPLAQAIAAPVVPGNARVLGNASRSLPYDDDPRARGRRVERVDARSRIGRVLLVVSNVLEHLVKHGRCALLGYGFPWRAHGVPPFDGLSISVCCNQTGACDQVGRRQTGCNK